ATNEPPRPSAASPNSTSRRLGQAWPRMRTTSANTSSAVRFGRACARIKNIAAEREEPRDMLGFGSSEFGMRVDDVVKPHVEMAARAEQGQRVGRRPTGIEQRQDVRDIAVAQRRQLVDAAHGDVERDKGVDGHDAPYRSSKR